MAVEAPGLNLGYAVAGDEFFKPSPTLAGPSGTGQFLFVVQSTTADLTMKVAGANASPVGVLQNTPPLGQAADVRFAGISKIVAGATITAGDLLMTDSAGRGITHTGSHFCIGQALQNAGGVGDVISAVIGNFGSF